MNFTDLTSLYFERSNALQSYWTIYVLVIGGLLAFSSLRKEPDKLTTALLTVLFAMFAYKNLGAIEDVSTQRIAVLQAMKQSEAASTDLATLKFRAIIEPTLLPPDIQGVRRFHLASDLLTLVILWAMERRRRRRENALKAS